jgi:hypothetical protein
MLSTNLRVDRGENADGHRLALCAIESMNPELTIPSMPDRRVLLRTALALALPAGLGVSSAQAPSRRAEEVPLGQPLREALMRGLNGPDRKLSAYRGAPGACVAPMMDWTDRHCRYFHRLLTRAPGCTPRW